jgi:rhodanese-related sulfurtransferase
MARGYKEMLAAADAEVRSLSVEEAAALGADPEVVFVDVRDPRELEHEGMIPGARHATRGMLEFWIDPESSYYKDRFGQDKKYVFFCAGGLRSALAAKTAQDMGLEPVAHVLGGFKGWKDAGGPTEPGEGKK